ncbi:similar to Saccharomyces cerevisiae YGL064C MRH4 Mitochondrial ATP-dependent RNA helicase of the DEAD-box family, plays an essential role in mitochondrial function [Maudiozyma saulgeensis]|uniref:RNA helicase n=1 Tax=Maudiozyma saulgeensis TaxID=1789683 RepID=A0A1X7R0I7_9SACH|nr:similar to Saccharomyces cerevisiae YGL064C MRH4 Mitochondrial ATP-dependent RNA helicase of the DEAD-box family, plays an essential role in mitochondrial function [Kazachstania saulgeensis]
MLLTKFLQCGLVRTANVIVRPTIVGSGITTRSYASGPRTGARGAVSRNQLNLTSSMKKNERSTNHKKKQRLRKQSGQKSNSSSKPFHYGEFGGLKENKTVNRDLDLVTALVNKISSFDDLKLLPEVREAIKTIVAKDTTVLGIKQDDISPSPIQILTVKRMSKSLMDPKLQTHAIAADTGSGKTIAYLLPLIDYMMREHLETPELWDNIHDKASIRSIILVPTHELVDQVYSTIEKTEETLGLHTFKWDIYTKYPDLIGAIKNRVDILVTTPSKLLTLFNIKMISNPERLLYNVKNLVIDEADTLMDPSWVNDTHSVIRRMKNLNHLIFCSATIPNEFNKTITRLFPSYVPITTARLHKLPRKLDFKIIDSSLNPFKGSKLKALAQILYAVNKDNSEEGYQKRCVVFVNEKDDVIKIAENMRNKYGLNVMGLTGNNKVEDRLQTIKLFTSPPRLMSEINTEVKAVKDDLKSAESLPLTIPGSNITIGPTKNTEIHKNNKSIILITTDLMARGLNFQGLGNVILYDVPKTSIDLVHRAGRTARMRQGGRLFMITDKKTKAWAKALPKIVKNNLALT